MLCDAQIWASPGHRQGIAVIRRMRVIAMLHQGIETPRKKSMHVLQVKHLAYTSATHRQCSQHAWVNIGDVYSM